jgi:O-antigen/teichoic acid export membrane protein
VLGLLGAGAIGLASSVAGFTDGVDGIVTQTLYPAICAVRDRADLLFESFVKSNRLALLWGMPFGFGTALFAPDLVHFVVGEKWHFAIIVIQAFGVVAAVDQLGFNWTAFLRALDQTRPLAVLGIFSVAAFFVVTVPLMIAFGLRGFAAGWLAWGAVTLVGRTYYLKQLFPRFSMTRHALRAMAPTGPAVGAVLLLRLVVGGHRTLPVVGAELAVFVLVAVAASVFIERALLREVVGYLRRRPGAELATS